MTVLIYVCQGCDLLFNTERRDRLTCSDACRVKALRNGSLKALRQLADDLQIKPGGILQAKAIIRLLPDREAQIMARRIKSLDDPALLADMHAAFTVVLNRQLAQQATP